MPKRPSTNDDSQCPDWVVALQRDPDSIPAVVYAVLRFVLPVAAGDALWEKVSEVVSRKGSEGAGDATGRLWRQDLIELFLAENLPRSDTRIPDPIVPEMVPVERVGDILGASGSVAETLGQYEHRPEQLAMAGRVMDAFNAGCHLMVEGGTGIGKSLAYLVPAVLWAVENAAPVVVSTNTKNLQRQLYDKDLPLLSRCMGVDFSSALIKGRLNYLCLRKFLAALENADSEFSAAERRALAGVLVWVVGSESGDLSECPGWSGGRMRALGPGVTATGDECMGRGCRFARRCFLLRARARALQADLVVANHALVFAEMGLDSPALPPYARIIFDEAHNLEEAATKHFSVELSLMRCWFEFGRLWRRSATKDGVGVIPALLRQVRSGALSGDEALTGRLSQLCWGVVDTVRRAEAVVPALFEALAALMGERAESRRLFADNREGSVWVDLDRAHAASSEAIEKVEKGIEELVDALRVCSDDQLPLHGEAVNDLSAQLSRLKELRLDAEFVLRADDEDFVFWVEPASQHQGGARAWGAPVHIGDRLATDLYEQKQSVVFVSATLSVDGSFGYLKKRIGLDRYASDRLQEFNAGTPFDYVNQSMVLVPTFLPDPAEGTEAYTEQLSIMLSELFRRTRGRALTLFTSYDMLRKTTAAVREALGETGITVWAQGEDESRETLTERFTEDVESVLMGTHSFWEGVDAMGETLSCLVVARLPFSVYTDPVVAARSERIEKQGGSAFRDYSLPSAVIRFRQGFGRLIRHRQDRGVVIVSDKRMVTKGYGRKFQRSIPARTVAVDDSAALFAAVEEFLG
jgi:ATP-dependent DNA helicase DinG